ncbi:hypothetical protein LXL04_022977 [Taraxacum kok-saghyz]
MENENLIMGKDEIQKVVELHFQMMFFSGGLIDEWVNHILQTRFSKLSLLEVIDSFCVIDTDIVKEILPYIVSGIQTIRKETYITRGPARSWQIKNIKNIMCTCIILHNMIVEDEGNVISNWSDDVDPPIRVHRGPAQEVQYQIKRNFEA